MGVGWRDSSTSVAISAQGLLFSTRCFSDRTSRAVLFCEIMEPEEATGRALAEALVFTGVHGAFATAADMKAATLARLKRQLETELEETFSARMIHFQGCDWRSVLIYAWLCCGLYDAMSGSGFYY